MPDFGTRLDELLEQIVRDYGDQRARVTRESPNVRVLHLDDYQLWIVLSSTREKLDLAPAKLAQVEELLLSNPTAIAVVVVGDGEEMPALALRMMRVRELLRNPSGIPRLVARAHPLGSTLRSIIERQTRTWQVPSSRLQQRAQTAPDLTTLFSANLKQALEAERGRSFRVPERTLAAQELDQSDSRLILDTLRFALDGANTDQIAEKLSAIEL